MIRIHVIHFFGYGYVVHIESDYEDEGKGGLTATRSGNDMAACVKEEELGDYECLDEHDHAASRNSQ
jgi:hypothetical protein